MATYYIVSYSYKKSGSSSTTSAAPFTVEAETEATAIRIVENKHPWM